MMRPTHILFNFLLLVVIFVFLRSFIAYPLDGITLGIIFIFSVVPDWDARLPFFKHRGFVHSLWGAIIFIFLMYALFNTLGISMMYLMPVAIAYIGHLVADSFTVTGINWLYPSNFNTRGPIKTSTISEGFFFAAVAILSYVVLSTFHVGLNLFLFKLVF